MNFPFYDSRKGVYLANFSHSNPELMLLDYLEEPRTSAPWGWSPRSSDMGDCWVAFVPRLLQSECEASLQHIASPVVSCAQQETKTCREKMISPR